MVLCYECGCSIPLSLPHGDLLPPYCETCLHLVRIRIVRDLQRWSCLQPYEDTVEPPRYAHRPEARRKAVHHG